MLKLLENEKILNVFPVPLWWNFTHVERGRLFVSSVETFKEAGRLQYFL